MRNIIKHTAVSLALVGLLVTASNASALAIGDANYLGTVNDGIPSSPANEVGYINTLTTLAAGAGDILIGTETYNRVTSALAGPFPTAVLAGGGKLDTGNPVLALPGTFQYILGKYDAEAAGSLVWYFAEGTSSVTLPATFNSRGLSHISWFNAAPSVPDGGVTAMLLGMALSGLAMLRRVVS